METEIVPCVAFQLFPVAARRLQQHAGAHHVGLDEVRRAVDGAVHVGLGGQVHDGIGAVLPEHPLHLPGIADVHLLETVAGVIHEAGQGIGIARVGELVEVHHRPVALDDEVTHQCRTDETGAAGDQQGLHELFSLVTRMSSITRYCRSEPKNISRASAGEQTMGSPRRLREVLRITPLPVSFSSSSMSA